jgi:hypothetical protein
MTNDLERGWFWPMSRLVVRDEIYQQKFSFLKARIAYQLLFYGPLILRDTDWINNITLRRAYSNRDSDDSRFLNELAKAGLLSLVHREDLDYRHLLRQGGAHVKREDAERWFCARPKDLVEFRDCCRRHWSYRPSDAQQSFRKQVRRLVGLHSTSRVDPGHRLHESLAARLLDATETDEDFRWGRIGPRGDLTLELCKLAEEERTSSPEAVISCLDEIGQSAHIHTSMKNVPKAGLIWSDEQLGCRRLLRSADGKEEDALGGTRSPPIEVPVIRPNDAALALLTSQQIVELRSSDVMKDYRRTLQLAMLDSGRERLGSCTRELVARIEGETWVQMTRWRKRQGPGFDTGWMTILGGNVRAAAEWALAPAKGPLTRSLASGKALSMFLGAEDPKIREERKIALAALGDVSRASASGPTLFEPIGEVTLAEGIIWER